MIFGALALLMLGCAERPLPRIAIVGIATECSTFSPARTDYDKFHVRRGADVFSYYPFMVADSGFLGRADWFPALTARATPGGMVTRGAYDSLVGEALERLAENLPYDGVFLDIHGAMSVEGLDDPEGDFILKVREVVGQSPVISTSMDPHGSVTHRLAQESDIITSYRMSPHEDRYITMQRAVENLLDRLEGGKGKPRYKAWIRVPILLPGERTSTRVEPGAGLYGAIPSFVDGDCVVDAAIWMSYPWADEPRNHGVVMAVGDDSLKVRVAAESLAQRFWDVREDFEFVAPTASLKVCLDSAINSTAKPYFVSDMGDNPTAGGAGDVSWTLAQLLRRPYFRTGSGKSLVYASIPGADLLANGPVEGEEISGYVGGVVDSRYHPPMRITGRVLKHIPRETAADGIEKAVVQVGSLKVIVTSVRKPYHYISSFEEVGIDITNEDIVMVKMGYLVEELYAAQRGWMMAHTRGGVDQELTSLPYKRLVRPIYPLDSGMSEPDLGAIFIPLSEF